MGEFLGFFGGAPALAAEEGWPPFCQCLLHLLKPMMSKKPPANPAAAVVILPYQAGFVIK